jgi:hypothetical protein
MAWATNSNITTTFVKMFGRVVEALVQQKGSVLRDAVRLETGIVGEEAYFDQIAATAAVQKVARNADTPLVKTEFNRRRVTMYDYEWADLLDKEDQLKMLVSPDSPVAQNAAWAMGRAMDDLIISAIGGTSYYGKAGGSSIALPSDSKIAVGTTGLTIDKLLEAKEKLDSHDVDPQEPRYCIVTSKQIKDLLNTTEVKSADYNTVKALAMGQLNSFLGFNFIMCNRLTVDGSSNRKVYAYAKNGILLAIAAGIKTEIERRADKSYATQVYLSMGIGSTRMEEKKIVEIACAE